MRFHRNAGSRGAAEWMCLTPDQRVVHCYARIVLAKHVAFEHNSADGWALGDLKWLSEPMPPSRHLVLSAEIAGRVRPDALARVPVGGWEPLWYRTGTGFWSRGRRLTGARWLLLGPGVAAVRGGRPA